MHVYIKLGDIKLQKSQKIDLYKSFSLYHPSRLTINAHFDLGIQQSDSGNTTLATNPGLTIIVFDSSVRPMQPVALDVTNEKLCGTTQMSDGVFTPAQDKTNVEPVHSYDAFHTRHVRPGLYHSIMATLPVARSP